MLNEWKLNSDDMRFPATRWKIHIVTTVLILNKQLKYKNFNQIKQLFLKQENVDKKPLAKSTRRNI